MKKKQSTTNLPVKNFRQYLQQELIKRCHKNPSYSLRAFAKQLDIEPSFLSKILNNKRSITPKTVRRLGSKLELSIEKLQKFENIHNNSKDDNITDASYTQLSIDYFHAISDWYHFAILELVKIPGIKINPKTISKKLGINYHQAGEALDRLIRLQLLRINNDGAIQEKPADHTTIGCELQSMALRKFHKQFLTLAINAIDQVHHSKRDISSMTMAISTEKIPQAREMIKRFRRRLSNLLEKGDSPDEVYHLSVCLYPITK